MIVVRRNVSLAIPQHDNAVPPRHRPIPASPREHAPGVNPCPRQHLPLPRNIQHPRSSALAEVERPDREVVDGLGEEGPEDEEVTANDGTRREAETGGKGGAGHEGGEGGDVEGMRGGDRCSEDVQVTPDASKTRC